MCTSLKSFQTSAFSTETALEAELGKDGLYYRTWKLCHPPMENDLFKKKMEELNESITESHHSTVIMGRIKVCHQLHITVWSIFLFSIMDKVIFSPHCWCGGGRNQSWYSKRGAQWKGLGIAWAMRGWVLFQQMQQAGRIWWNAAAQGWQWGAKKEKPCLQGDWRQSERANMSLCFTSCIH